ncbi:hypothetical protein Nepgr_022798 [Nepenthes gracilis]|uniref:Uncharacterized protein n=1 Tax=Nepenthes gracilis TaxID=150966 RepID=A0AAD3XYS0_NEPGR|nr:hypothetical protein Nepgr_022798 [Nepenthes gracilis]
MQQNTNIHQQNIRATKANGSNQKHHHGMSSAGTGSNKKQLRCSTLRSKTVPNIATASAAEHNKRPKLKMATEDTSHHVHHIAFQS